MPKNLMFSLVFPKTHPRAGEKTRFVEKIWISLLRSGQFSQEVMHQYLDKYDGLLWDISYIERGMQTESLRKIHTIRAGKSRKQGELFNPRVWSGKPYASKQIQFAPTLKYEFIEDVAITPRKILDLDDDGPDFETVGVLTDRKRIDCIDIAINDGLKPRDFIQWFNKPFEGQILIFSQKNPY